MLEAQRKTRRKRRTACLRDGNGSAERQRDKLKRAREIDTETFDWPAVATVATWFMTLIIHRAEHRDTHAIHASWTNACGRMGTLAAN